MRILDARYCSPINALSGLYVSIEGSKEEVYGSIANDLAIKTAREKGWNGQGRATVGIPSRMGVLTYTKAYWFHDRLQ